MSSSSPPPSFPHSNFSRYSPPYPPGSQTPQTQQRRASELSVMGGKKRKMSMASATSSSHPLRHATFPIDDGMRRSPSYDTSSIVSGSIAGGGLKKRKHGKGKGKGKVTAEDEEDEAVKPGGKYHKTTAEDGEEEEDEDEDDMDEYDMLTMENRTDEQKAKDAEQRAMLIGQMDPDQFDRHTASRMVKFADAATRRIINQNVSQSVPSTVVLAIKSVAKVFTGDLIEEARRVQAEWNASDPDLIAYMQWHMQRMEVPFDSMSEEVKHKAIRFPVAPLEPEHLREAVRRMKIRRHENGVGMMGLPDVQHQSGVERFAIRKGVYGKRLFK